MVTTESIAISDITIPKGRRGIKQENVQEIAKSIRAIGLLQPVGVTQDRRLVFGLHRIEAHKLLGITHIHCLILTADELQCRLAEIDENLTRASLTAMEWSQALKRRKEVYEAIHPETKHGGDRTSEEAKSKRQNADLNSTPSFAADTAKKSGVSESTIERDVHVAEAIPADVQEAIAPAEPTKTELRDLAKLPEKQQRTAAAKITSGKAKSVKAALPKKPPKPKVHRADAPIKRAQVDDNRKKVPEELLDVFEARDEFAQIYRDLWSLAARIKALKAKPAGRHIRSDEGDVVERVADRVAAACPSIIDEDKGWLPAGAVE